MATKTMAVSEDAYQVLADLKRPGESFSDVIERHIKRGSNLHGTGAWEDTSDGEVQGFRHKLAKMRRRSDEKLSDTLKRLRW